MGRLNKLLFLLICGIIFCNAQICGVSNTTTFTQPSPTNAAYVLVSYRGLTDSQIRVNWRVGPPNFFSATIIKSASTELAVKGITYSYTTDPSSASLIITANFARATTGSLTTGRGTNPGPSGAATTAADETENDANPLQASFFLVSIISLIFAAFTRNQIVMLVIGVALIVPMFAQAPPCVFVDVTVTIPGNVDYYCYLGDCRPISGLRATTGARFTSGTTTRGLITSGRSTTGLLPSGVATSGSVPVPTTGSFGTGSTTAAVVPTPTTGSTTAQTGAGSGTPTTGAQATPTTGAATTSPVTSSPLTTSPLTTGSDFTTGEMTTSRFTSGRFTSGRFTSGSITTGSATSGPPRATTGVYATTGAPLGPLTFTNTVPTDFCFQSDGIVNIYGTNFGEDTTITLNFTSSGYTFSPAIIQRNLTWMTFYVYWIENGKIDLLIDRPGSPRVTVRNAYFVHPSLFVFTSDPRVIYNGIDLQVSFYASGLFGRVSALTLYGPGGSSVSYNPANVTQVVDKWSRFTVIFPRGRAVGSWDVELTDNIGCYTYNPGIFTVTNTLSIYLDRTDPQFAWNATDTGIQIYAFSNSSAIIPVPRVYLSNVNTVAVILKAVVSITSNRIQAVIPAGVATGVYDLVVVNPNNAVGVLRNAITITGKAPPEVTALVPGFINSNDQNAAIAVYGNFFDGGCSVAVYCVNWLDPTTIIWYNAKSTTCTSSTVINTVIDGNEIGAGNICILRVTNGDTAYFDYQAVVTRTPANKLLAWQPFAATLITPRRGHASVSAAVTTSSKYIYVVGGDNGSINGGYNTVECSQMDKFGTLQGFFRVPYDFPTRIAYGQLTKVGRFLYYVGGFDSITRQPTNRMWRAEVLDPLKTPTLDGEINVVYPLTLKKRQTIISGLPAGVYYYKVSATFPANDTNNPGGESLPGEVFTVYLPPTDGTFFLQLRLYWNAIPEANGYKVWRVPTPDSSITTLQLLGVLTGNGNTTFTDTGLSTVNGTAPLPIGSTGVWHFIGNMTTTRWGHSTVNLPSPGVANKFYVTSIGGSRTNVTSGNSILGSYETFSISVTPPPRYSLIREKQTWGSAYLLTRAGNVTNGRFFGGAARVGGEDMTTLSFNESMIIYGPGWSSQNSFNKVWHGGTLFSGVDDPDIRGRWNTSNDQSAPAYGYCLFQSFGLVHTIGGVDGAAAFPSAVQTFGRVLAQGLCPTLQQNPFGCSPFSGEPSGAIDRGFAGCAKENALFFLVGGVATGNVLSNTVLRAPQ